MRSAMAVLLAGATLIASSSSPVPPPQAPPGWPAVVDGYRQALGRAGIVGSSLMIVRDGRVVARQNEGEQDRDRGLLSLDDPVVKYVPELRLVHDPFGDVSDIKVRHLF